jgi:hypothetical protein
MRDLDDFIIRLIADNSSRAELIAALNREAAATERVARRVRARTSDEAERSREARRRVERIGRILFFLRNCSPASGATDADLKLYDLLDQRLRSRGEWLRASDELRGKIDAWAAKQPNKPSRFEAILRLVEFGLASAPQARGKKDAQENTAESTKIAGRQIDRMGDPAATSETRASRKCRLLKGPKEFRKLRGNVSKWKR